MKNATVIFDNGGGITLQLGDWAHWYQDAAQAARDYAEYIKTGSTDGWDGLDEDAAELEPSSEEISNGGYRVYTSDEIDEERQAEDPSSWYNINHFCTELNKILD
jgi:hypothetical protein